MTFHDHYIIRKRIRRELQAARCADKDHSVERYKSDAEKLNKMMLAMGIFDQPTAKWGN